MKTRTKGPAKAAAEAVESTKPAIQKVQLAPEPAIPPQLLILPKYVSAEARIVSIENPRYLTKSRYFVCPEHGFYEFMRIAAPKPTPRSWLISPQESISHDAVYDQSSASGLNGKNTFEGYVTRSADLFIATPADPLFFILPSLTTSSVTKSSAQGKGLFLSTDDYLERVAFSSPQLASLVREDFIRASFEKRIAAVCDTVEAGGENMYRLSEEKLLQELLQKAKKMVEQGLPASMEEKLIRKALEVPMRGVKVRENANGELETEEDTTLAEATLSNPLGESQVTQMTASTISTAASSFSEASTAATSFSDDSTSADTMPNSKKLLPAIVAPEGVAYLFRLRTALFFICSAYIAPHFFTLLKKLVASPTSPINFGSLEAHLTYLAKLRQDAIAVRSLGDFSRKRSTIEDDEDGGMRTEKKRKLEEDDKRKKAGESRAVKSLKKVNVNGMKKMSDFFKKK